jgi:hypothetical protein
MRVQARFRVLDAGALRTSFVNGNGLDPDRARLGLLFEDLFNVSDLVLDFAGEVFGFAFRL